MVSPLTAQHFWLLGTGNGTFDAADKSQLNTVNPVNRDTATVPPYGWVAFRFLVCVSSCRRICTCTCSACHSFLNYAALWQGMVHGALPLALLVLILFPNEKSDGTEHAICKNL